MSTVDRKSNEQSKNLLRPNRIFIDCQILQTPAYDRGMGKYTLNLLKSLLQTFPRSMDVRLIFNENLTSGQRIKDVIEYINGGKAEALDLPTDIDSSNYVQARGKAESKITAYVQEVCQGNQAYYLMTAPFFVGFPSVFPEGENLTKLAVVYDITPQKIWRLQRIFPDDLYFSHYEILLKADHLLTISSAVKDDILSLVGINDEKVTVIDGGPMLSNGILKDAYGWSDKKPYILHVTAPIVHKNNERAIKGFALFNEREGHKYTLYITSHFSEEDQAKLLRLSPDIVFSGNISDEELANGYKNASAVLFSSLAEGLGMPVLEAGVYKVPVACSRIPVLEELSPAAFYLFDPLNIADIARSLESAVNQEGWGQRRLAVDKMCKKYTWAHSAEKLYDLLENAAAVKKTATHTTIRIVTPALNAQTPASYLANVVSVYLKSIGYDVIVVGSLGEQAKIPPFAYYAIHPIETRHDNVLTITISNTLLNRGIRIEMPGNTLRFKASFTKDRALALCSWTYNSSASGDAQAAYQLSQSLGAML